MDLRVSVEIPAHIFSDHDPWSRLQLLARLGSPDGDPRPDLNESTDAIRRTALAAAHRAKQRRRAMLRTSVERARAHPDVDWAKIGGELEAMIEETLRELRAAQEALCAPRADDTERVARERRLAAEFLSNQVIELISRVQRAVDHLASSERRPVEEALKEPLSALRRCLARSLGAEYAYRREAGFPSPSGNPVELERYVSRASSLKKHFQEILFLRVDSEHADKRFRYLVSSFAAIMAALVVLPMTALATGEHGLSGLGFGLTTTFVIGVLAYGVRERIKEGVRGWLTSRAAKVGRRTTLTTSPAPPEEPLRVARMREVFSTRRTRELDPAHPDVWSAMPMIRLGYQMQGVLEGSPKLAAKGAERVKMVFRYDFTPLFSRLHDPVEEVPILDDSGERLSFAEAPRLYRFPIESQLFDGETTHTFSGTLLAHKYGLVRVDIGPDAGRPHFAERAASLSVGAIRRR